MSIHSTGEALPTFDPRIFAETLIHSAEWRREKADEFADDARNAEAADMLEALAEQITDLDEEELSPLVRALGDYDLYEVEIVNGYVSRIGFDHFPASAKAPVHELATELGEDA